MPQKVEKHTEAIVDLIAPKKVFYTVTAFRKQFGDPKKRKAKIITKKIKGKMVSGIVVQTGESGVYDIEERNRERLSKQDTVHNGEEVVDANELSDAFEEEEGDVWQDDNALDQSSLKKAFDKEQLQIDSKNVEVRVKQDGSQSSTSSSASDGDSSDDDSGDNSGADMDSDDDAASAAPPVMCASRTPTKRSTARASSCSVAANM